MCGAVLRLIVTSMLFKNKHKLVTEYATLTLSMSAVNGNVAFEDYRG